LECGFGAGAFFVGSASLSSVLPGVSEMAENRRFVDLHSCSRPASSIQGHTFIAGVTRKQSFPWEFPPFLLITRSFFIQYESEQACVYSFPTFLRHRAKTMIKYPNSTRQPRESAGRQGCEDTLQQG